MTRRTLFSLATLGLLVVGAIVAVRAWSAAEAEAHRAERAAQRAERLEAFDERMGQVVEESRGLMPDVVGNVALGFTMAQVREARGARLGPAPTSAMGLVMLEERLENGGQVMYGFERGGQRLVQVQILSMLPSADAIAPHLAAMNDTYGRPTGIWDCPTTGGVPTRRFTWRRAHTTVSDVFLVYGDRISLTFYIATSDQIGLSLRMASCTPVPVDGIAEFPVATAEQMERAAREGR